MTGDEAGLAAGNVADIQLEEIRLQRLLSARLTTRVMVDVGAHHGTMLGPFLAAGFDVYAFEPIESNRNRLRERFDDPANLVLRPEAVSRESGAAELHLAVHDDGSQHDHYHSLERIGADKHHRKGESVLTPTVRLDDLVARGEIPGSVGMLKIDTEGHDLAVLEGAASVAADVVAVEFWGPQHPLGRCPSPAERMIELMSARGYASVLLIEHIRGSTTFHTGSDPHTDPAAWGNILFFHARVDKLYEEIVRWCRRDWAPATVELADLFMRVFPGRSNLRFYEVGAFPGDLAADILNTFPESKGTLFASFEEHAARLEERLGGDHRIEIRRAWVGNGDLARHSRASEAPAGASPDVTAIGRAWQEAGAPQVDLIGVHTRDDALEVLRGAEALLATKPPGILIVSVGFIPGGHQVPPHQLLAVAADRGYRLARIANVQNTRAGELAIADLILLHESVPIEDCEPPFVAADADDLSSVRRKLRAANSDRRAKRERIRRLSRQRDELRSRLKARKESG